MKEVKCKKWSEFREWIEKNRCVVPVYWRGQSDSCKALASRFERTILNLNGGYKDDAAQVYPYDGRYVRGAEAFLSSTTYANMRDEYLNRFKVASAGCRGSHPANLNDDEWWALGRHYGLITPLLDWTESPYIAAFFAMSGLASKFVETGKFVPEGNNIAVYQLVHTDSLEGEGLQILRPIVDELDRMQGQRGLFSRLSSEKYFELQGFLDDNGLGNVLTQILISDQALIDGMNDLADHGIDHRLLFPDLHGAAQSANERWLAL